MRLKSRIRRLLKFRFAIVYPFVIFLAFYATPDDKSILFGVWFMLAGLVLRVWANGYAIKLEKLTLSGPYAFVRHPLYLGTLLIALGFTIMLKIYFIGALFLLTMAIVYRRTMLKEEEMLIDKFGPLYEDYKKTVRALLPGIHPYSKGEKWGFSLRRLIHSQEYKLSIWMVILVIAFHLKDEFMIERESLDAKIVWLICLIIILTGIDIAGELSAWKKR